MNRQTSGTAGLATRILLLVLLGAPLVAYLWETLNNLLSGYVEPTRLLIAVPVAAAFAFLLRGVARIVERLGDASPNP